MILSPIFKTRKRAEVEQNILAFLNAQTNVMSASTISSPRAVGDAMQSILEAAFGDLLKEYIRDYSSDFARRAMADLAFTDTEGFYHVVDIKTHRLDTTFNMPNLTSVERLTRFYENDKNYFDVLLIAYAVDDLNVSIKKVSFVPIEHLDWACLTIGALGWGQIQIANSNRVVVDDKQRRRAWMIKLCDILLEFYPAEVMKITKRVEHFAKVKQYWLDKPEDI
ncbi:MAG: hypothetical protein ACYDGY_01020 [Acidimicrobiales bacterium]